MTMKRARFDVYKSRDGYRWRLVSRNGKIVAVGEAYTRESSAKRSLRAVYSAARDAFHDEAPEPAPMPPILLDSLEAADHG